jgi:hypothetical protein
MYRSLLFNGRQMWAANHVSGSALSRMPLRAGPSQGRIRNLRHVFQAFSGLDRVLDFEGVAGEAAVAPAYVHSVQPHLRRGTDTVEVRQNASPGLCRAPA